MTILTWDHWAADHGDEDLTGDPANLALLDAPVCGAWSPFIVPYSEKLAQEREHWQQTGQRCDRDHFPRLLSLTVGDLLEDSFFLDKLPTMLTMSTPTSSTD